MTSSSSTNTPPAAGSPQLQSASASNRQGRAAPGQLTFLRGFRFSAWWRLLRLVQFDVDGPYRRYAWMITLSSLNYSRAARRELRNYGTQVSETQVQPPIFILGHWRSGTTLLHTLLTHDPQFAFPNLLQVTQPHNFLTAEPYAEAALARAQAVRRDMDQMEVTFRSPGEEEGALAVMSLCSPMLGQMFPRQRDIFDRYLTFEGVTQEQRQSWQKELRLFTQKLSLRYPGRPLLLKSPQNTARIQMILEVFPQARFINIVRNPYVVFRSTQKLQATAAAQSRLQDLSGGGASEERIDTWLLNRYQALYQAFFRQRDLVRAGHYTELRFEDLEQDMQTGRLAQVERIYTELGLPGFDQAAPALKSYVTAQAGYVKNIHPELPAGLRARVRQAAESIFQTWEYPE